MHVNLLVLTVRWEQQLLIAGEGAWHDLPEANAYLSHHPKQRPCSLALSRPHQ